MTVYPHLDSVTVARFVLDDFDLTENELVAMSDPHVRYALEDALRQVADLDTIAARAVSVWRDRREQP